MNLDNLTQLKKLDPKGMLADVYHLAEQIENAWKTRKKFSPKNFKKNYENILLCGTGGGSAMAGEIVRSYLYDRLKIPFLITQDYNIPSFVGKKTLVITASHSGKTEETISAFQQAKQKGATIVDIGMPGGKLYQLVKESGEFLYDLTENIMPRADVGSIVVAFLKILIAAGLITIKEQEIRETVRILILLKKSLQPETPTSKNLAKKVVLLMKDCHPVIYGSYPYTESAAMRLKNQLAENGKILSMYNLIPKLHHDEIVGWDMPSALRKRYFIIFLRSKDDSERITKRFEATKEVIGNRAAGFIEIWSVGKGRLAQIFSLVLIADYISCYQALSQKNDPTEVAIINVFKKKLGQ